MSWVLAEYETSRLEIKGLVTAQQAALSISILSQFSLSPGPTEVAQRVQIAGSTESGLHYGKGILSSGNPNPLQSALNIPCVCALGRHYLSFAGY